MKRINAFIIFLSCLISICNASESAVALYSKWQHIDNGRLMDMGQKFDNNNSCDSALVCYTLVADKLRNNSSDSEDKRMLARALNNIGFIYATYFFDYQKAMEMFDESLKVSQGSGYNENIPYVYLNVGGVYLGCNMMYGKKLFSDEVWDYLERALKSSIETKQHEVAIVAFLNMGQMYFGDHRDDKLKKAIQTLEKADIPLDMKLRAFGLEYAGGLKSYMAQDYLKAAEYFKRMISLIPEKDIHTIRYELIALMAETEAYKSAGDYSAAIAKGTELLEKSRICGSSDMEITACGTLSDLYDKTDQKDKASDYMLLFHHKKDSTLSERDMTMLSKMPLVNELHEMKQTLEKERTRRQAMTIVTMVIIFFVLMLGLYLLTVIRSRRKLKSYVKELYRKNVELLKAEQRAKELRVDMAGTECKYSSSNLTATESKQIAECILQIMDNTELITDSDFSLKDLSEHAGYSYKTVSQVINETLGKNFKTLLNEYRIKEACKRLLDSGNYGQYTIEHIAESVGFNSRSNFTVMFKKITGLSPMQFQKNAQSESDK